MSIRSKLPSYMSLQGSTGKFLDCYNFNCLSEIRWEVRPRSHLCKHIASVCHVTSYCEHALFLNECLFDFVLSVIDGSIEQCVCIKFCMKLSKSATEACEMLCRVPGNIFQARQWFLNGNHVSRLVSVS
jgi:hypothetical protein